MAGHDSLLAPPIPDSSSSNYTQDWQRSTVPSFSNCHWPSRPAAGVGGMAVSDYSSLYGSSGGINNLAPPHHDPPQHGTRWQCGYHTTSTQFGQCRIASPLTVAPGFNNIGMADQQRNTAWLSSQWHQMGVPQPPYVTYNNSTMMPGTIEPSIDPRELDLISPTARAAGHEVSKPLEAYVVCPPQPVPIMSTDWPFQERPAAETVCFGMVREPNTSPLCVMNCTKLPYTGSQHTCKMRPLPDDEHS